MPEVAFFVLNRDVVRNIHDKVLNGDVGPALLFELGAGVDFVVQLPGGNQVVARWRGIENAIFEGEVEWGVGVV